MLRVALIEDDATVREGLAGYFNLQADVTCVLAAESVEDALRALADPALAPDVVLTDLGLPGMSGLEGIVHVRGRCPAADIIVFSVYHDAARIFQALCAGATGYLLKSMPLPEILASLHSVRAGGAVMSPDVARQVVAYFQQGGPRAAVPAPLSPREQQIVNCLAEGLSQKMIADRVCLSIDAVRYHLKNIYKKLHVSSRAELLVKVMRREP